MNSINEYINLLGDVPDFLIKYLELDCLKRLKKVGYFCGMDYASKNIYNFKYKISRFDHSLSCALITWKFTKRKEDTIAALFHDISTPCFSHVIDYMNEDYELQESTEAKTSEILLKDIKLKEYLKNDNILLNSIVNFKKYSIVDLDRPKMCADRIDGIFLTSLSWTKEIDIDEILPIINDIKVYINENNEEELGFKNKYIIKKVINLNDDINKYTHFDSDTYMMLLLANITKYAINNSVINYDDLYILNEEEVIKIFNNYSKKDLEFKKLLDKFYNIKEEDIEKVYIPNIKNKIINPLINGKRY